MTRKPYILIPPSEGKAVGGALGDRVGAFDVPLGGSRRRVIEVLAEQLSVGSPATLEKVLKVRGPLLARAIEAMTLLARGEAPLLPAWQRYSGVVWTHLDAGTLTSAQRRRLLIPSGLYGVTTGADPVADYRLKMDVTLPSLGGVARFWRPHLSAALAEHAEGSVVVNLLPKEHESSIDWSVLNANCLVINMLFVQADGRGAAGHAAKAVKGVVARRLVQGGLAALDSFRWEGWRVHRNGESILVIAPRAKG